MSRDLGRDVLDLEKLRQENFGLIFLSIFFLFSFYFLSIFFLVSFYILLFSFYFPANPTLKSPKLALKCANLALKRPNWHL